MSAARWHPMRIYPLRATARCSSWSGAGSYSPRCGSPASTLPLAGRRASHLRGRWSASTGEPEHGSTDAANLDELSALLAEGRAWLLGNEHGDSLSDSRFA